MYLIEYKHKYSKVPEAWRATHVLTQSLRDAATMVKNMTKMHGDDFIFRHHECNVVSNIKPV